MKLFKLCVWTAAPLDSWIALRTLHPRLGALGETATSFLGGRRGGRGGARRGGREKKEKKVYGI